MSEMVVEKSELMQMNARANSELNAATKSSCCVAPAGSTRPLNDVFFTVEQERMR